MCGEERVSDSQSNDYGVDFTKTTYSQVHEMLSTDRAETDYL